MVTVSQLENLEWRELRRAAGEPPAEPRAEIYVPAGPYIIKPQITLGEAARGADELTLKGYQMP